MRNVFLLAIIGMMWACSSENNTSNESNDDVVTDTLVVIDTITQIVAVDSVYNPETKSLGYFFNKYGVEGGFILFDPQENRYVTYNGQRADEPYLPASTFKILNSLIALETGVIGDTNVVLKWDGVERQNPEWNKDQDMQEAFRNSTVWFYQNLARGIGKKRMQHYVKKANYGNENIEGEIDEFWLNGELRITMREQVKILRKLYRNELPFSRRSQQKVKGLMEILQAEKYTVYGKTGWANQTGWFVGFVIQDYEEIIESPTNGQDTLTVEQDSLAVVKTKHIKNGYYFATNIDIKEDKDAAARQSITIDILKNLNIIE